MFDSILIDKFFQPIADKIEALAGISCFFLARLFYVMTVVAMIMDLTNGGPEDLLKYADIFVIIACSIFFVNVPSDKSYGSDEVNPERKNIMGMSTRSIATVAFVVIVVAMLRYGFEWGMFGLALSWFGIHFHACEPLPPQKI